MTGDDEESLDIWGFLNRRKSFIILLAIVGGGLGYLYFQRQTPRYASSALLQVIHRASDKRVENLMADRNLNDANHVIKSDKLLTACYENHNLGQLSTLAGLKPGDAARRIGGMISASSEKNSNILRINCEGSNPNDTAVIANAVAAEFNSHHEYSYKSAVDTLQNLLQTAQNDISGNIKTLEGNYSLFETNSPLDLNGKNIHREVFENIQRKITDLVITEAELLAEIEQIQRAFEAGGQREALMLLIGKQSNISPKKIEEVDDSMASAKTIFQSLMPMLLEEAILSEEVGDGHPRLVALRNRIAIFRSQLETLAGMSPVTQETGEAVPRPDVMTIYIDSLKQELELRNAKRQKLESLASNEEENAVSLRVFEVKRANFLRQISRESSLLEGVQSQIRNMELPTNVGGVTASILGDARHGNLVYPKLSSFLGMGAFLGGLIGLALGYIVELADRSFRKPEEIVREFGIPIVGHIPYIQDKKLKAAASKSTLDETIITQHLPRSRPAEAYRAVRTAVCFSAVGRDHRVIQVTSPAAGDGKSTLAQNFAVSLAQSGKKTIIIESDFRRPKVHKLTGVTVKPGIVDVLRGNAEVDDAIHQTEVENFFAMPCGGRPNNPSELLAMPEYEQLLEVLREKFDYVIVDTPPVLVVTDPCSVAPRVDGVLLCVRLSRHTRDFGRRALEQLRDVGANMTGIVINGVEEADAYGYGNYNYSDYKYQYRDYSYAYDDKSNEAYFEEADSSSDPVLEETTPAS